MTETIFHKGDIVYKLECRLSFGFLTAEYLFKLKQRGKGKRKWLEINGYERQYRATTDMKDILLYLTKEEVMMVAEIEHENLSPQKFNIFQI